MSKATDIMTTRIVTILENTNSLSPDLQGFFTSDAFKKEALEALDGGAVKLNKFIQKNEDKIDSAWGSISNLSHVASNVAAQTGNSVNGNTGNGAGLGKIVEEFLPGEFGKQVGGFIDGTLGTAGGIGKGLLDFGKGGDKGIGLLIGAIGAILGMTGKGGSVTGGIFKGLLFFGVAMLAMSALGMGDKGQQENLALTSNTTDNGVPGQELAGAPKAEIAEPGLV